MLHATAPPDFLEPAHEWRRLFSETWGTFLLDVVAAGADVVGAERRRGDAERGGRRTEPDGHGHHLFHGRCRGRPSQSDGHLGVRRPAQFSVAAGAWLYHGAGHRRR